MFADCPYGLLDLRSEAVKRTLPTLLLGLLAKVANRALSHLIAHLTIPDIWPALRQSKDSLHTVCIVPSMRQGFLLARPHKLYGAEWKPSRASHAAIQRWGL